MPKMAALANQLSLQIKTKTFKTNSFLKIRRYVENIEVPKNKINSPILSSVWGKQIGEREKIGKWVENIDPPTVHLGR